MTKADDTQKFVADISDDELRAVVSRLVAKLQAHLGDQDEMWTFSSLSKLVGIEPDDPMLVAALRILATGDRGRMLDMHFLFFDPNDDESDGEKIEDKDVAAAYEHGYLVDPRRGIEIHDFEDAIVPYFTVHGAPNHG
ncbi:hypothetical protein ABE424_13175 [Stenotrophomonas sp. TWI1149]|uniref:hypothetical protein n=1 Tax=unclassified Stenotrophomonas TaxID=196198 RepID=UPI0032091377